MIEGMTLNEYQERAMTTCMETSKNVEYMLLNMIGEVGELCEKVLPSCKDYNMRRLLGDMVVTGQQAGKVAKGIRKGTIRVYEPIKLGNMTVGQICDINKESGDVLWQLAGFCEVIKARLEGIAIMNLQKLAARKEAGTIDGNGDGVSGAERTVE